MAIHFSEEDMERAAFILECRNIPEIKDEDLFSTIFFHHCAFPVKGDLEQRQEFITPRTDFNHCVIGSK